MSRLLWICQHISTIVSSDEWFTPEKNFNPSLRRIREAIFHAITQDDTSRSPLDAPNPVITQYFEPPDYLRDRTEKPLAELEKVLAIEKGLKQR